jgi:hypothetical protein
MQFTRKLEVSFPKYVRAAVLYSTNLHFLPKKEFSTDNLMVQIHFVIVMIRWTGLAP